MFPVPGFTGECCGIRNVLFDDEAAEPGVSPVWPYKLELLEENMEFPNRPVPPFVDGVAG
jgi:hypothetical protein